MRRALAILLCIVLLLAALPMAAFAAPQELSEEEALKQQIHRVYKKCLADANVESFKGLCGLMTSCQLYELGINASLAQVCDGKKQFDTYLPMKQTTGGYHVTAYSAKDYTLEQALNEITRNGTQDARNILIGFESTSTEAGASFGHACVIHTIHNGIAYFVENYSTYAAGQEGNVITLTIPQVVSFYNDWTVFDGVIHFGDRTYADSCQTFATDLFVRSRFASTLRSEPCLLTENDCIRLRNIAAGEVLHATAVLMNARGELYYRVDDGAQTGYVAANAVGLVRLNNEALSAEDISIPETAQPGTDITVAGSICARNSNISAMRVTVADMAGDTVLEGALDVTGCSCKLTGLNEQLAFDSLAEGTYEITVSATAACVAVRGTGLVTQYVDQEVHSQYLVVGAETEDAPLPGEKKKAAEKTEDGWFWKDGTWYCYKQGRPCSGWVYHLGVVYYLNEDGSVTTGFAQIDDQLRYFSATGALCKGWLVTQEGTRYWLDDGSEAKLWQQIDGERFYFGQDGLLVTEGVVADGDEAYQIQPDGTAVLFTGQ